MGQNLDSRGCRSVSEPPEQGTLWSLWRVRNFFRTPQAATREALGGGNCAFSGGQAYFGLQRMLRSRYLYRKTLLIMPTGGTATPSPSGGSVYYANPLG